MNQNIYNIRTLIVDIVQKANSGHPGAPLGLTPFVYTLFKDYLKINPLDENWPHRDIFILSNGHACNIQYIMNFLLGFCDLQDLKSFRQVNSKTPGHPESKGNGIEVTTGPLGQGVANSVGFAISLKKLGLNNNVYCIFGDGCYMEGISQEAFSITANLNLNNLTFIYDYNEITIDGPTKLSMNENVILRFKSLNFEVFEVDGENIEQIKKALEAKTSRTKMIILYTKIGRDSVVEGDAKAHGSPIGEEGVRKLKEKYNIPQEPFYISEDLIREWKEIRQRKIEEANCNTTGNGDVQETGSVKTNNLTSIVNEKINLEKIFFDFEIDKSELATRKAFSKILDQIIQKGKFICGSADLLNSCLNKFSDKVDFTDTNRCGNYINFGVREHAMFGIMNGISGHGYFIPIFSTFLNFVTYGYPSVRLAALDKLNNIYVLTHDSIGLGEDGPTHQPIEVLATMRATPNLIVLRPCDIKECKGALILCLKLQGPKAVVLSRQKVSFNEQSCVDKCQYGAYYLIEHNSPDFILIGTGSEVELCLQIEQKYKNYKISVVSFLSWEVFELQSLKYKQEIFPKSIPKISVEALATFGWHKYSDFQIGLDRFGWSGKCKEVFDEAGFTCDKIIKIIEGFLNEKVEL